MMDVTAIVLSERGYNRRFKDLHVLVHYSTIRSPMDLCKARFEAVKSVGTKHFFYLDDDDQLPLDYVSVVQECVNADVAVAYTDESVYTPTSAYVRKSSEYSQSRHLLNRLLIHHLAVCNTQKTMQAIAKLPQGCYCPEMLLYWELAKSGTVYVPRIGYIWYTSEDGMHRWPETSKSWANTQAYCVKDRHV